MTLLCLETPETLDELKTIITGAKNARIRVVGAQHSCEDATHGRVTGERDVLAISMVNFDAITIVDDQRRRKEGNPYALVRIEAGVHIAESPYIHPVPKPQAQLYRWLEQHGLALPVVGGVAHQTVVGFLATGSGGGSQTHCLHDAIVAIELVDGHGRHREFRSEDPEFAAAGVSLGLLGVVVSVTLKLDPRFQVYGKEVFARWRAHDPAKDTRDFLNKHEYARMIWWPQTKVVQWWSCERVVAREGFHANPYVPVGLKPFERQIVTNILLTLCGNLESLNHLRGVADKFRAARVLEYLELVDVHERIRPVAARETTVEVLRRPTHFHWTRSRFRHRRRSARAPLSTLGPELTADLLRDLSLASERVLARAVLAAGDEIMKRLFYISQGNEIVDPTKRRQALDAYGDYFSHLFATDRDVGPIRVGGLDTRVEALGHALFGKESVKLSVAEFADYLGETAAAYLVPIEDEQPNSLWSHLLLVIVRRVVYTQIPKILGDFFQEFTHTTTGFCDWDFNGLAVDRAINHHLVQTKFSEIWVRGKDAEKAIARLQNYLSPATDRLSESENNSTAFGWLQDYIATACETWSKLSQVKGSDPITGTTDALEAWQPDTSAGVDRVDPVELFRRRGAYSMELYAGKAINKFYLYPGSSDDGTPWVRLNFFWWAYNGGSQRDFFKGLWTCLEGLSYRCHWGKELPITNGRLPWDAEYRAKVDAFLQIRKQLDPNELFYTNHWKEILEPPATVPT